MPFLPLRRHPHAPILSPIADLKTASVRPLRVPGPVDAGDQRESGSTPKTLPTNTFIDLDTPVAVQKQAASTPPARQTLTGTLLDDLHLPEHLIATAKHDLNAKYAAVLGPLALNALGPGAPEMTGPNMIERAPMPILGVDPAAAGQNPAGAGAIPPPIGMTQQPGMPPMQAPAAPPQPAAAAGAQNPAAQAAATPQLPMPMAAAPMPQKQAVALPPPNSPAAGLQSPNAQLAQAQVQTQELGAGDSTSMPSVSIQTGAVPGMGPPNGMAGMQGNGSASVGPAGEGMTGQPAGPAAATAGMVPTPGSHTRRSAAPAPRNTPASNPINVYGALSMKGEVNGNAAFGTANSTLKGASLVGTKLAAVLADDATAAKGFYTADSLRDAADPQLSRAKARFAQQRDRLVSQYAGVPGFDLAGRIAAVKAREAAWLENYTSQRASLQPALAGMPKAAVADTMLGEKLAVEQPRASAAGEGNLPYVLKPWSEYGEDAMPEERYVRKDKRRVDSILPPRYKPNIGRKTTTGTN